MNNKMSSDMRSVPDVKIVYNDIIIIRPNTKCCQLGLGPLGISVATYSNI